MGKKSKRDDDGDENEATLEAKKLAKKRAKKARKMKERGDEEEDEFNNANFLDVPDADDEEYEHEYGEHDEREEDEKKKKNDNDNKDKKPEPPKPGEFPLSSTKVYMGNLSWQIDDDSLKEAFSDIGEIKSIVWMEEKLTEEVFRRRSRRVFHGRRGKKSGGEFWEDSFEKRV